MKKIYILLLVIFTTVFAGCTDNEDVSINKSVSTEEKLGKLETKDVFESENNSFIELIDKKTNEILGDYKDNVAIYFKNLNTY